MCDIGAVPVKDLLPGPELRLLAPLLDLDPFLDGHEEGGIKFAPFALAEGFFEFADYWTSLRAVLDKVLQVLLQLWVLAEVLSLLGECILDSLRLGCSPPSCPSRVYLFHPCHRDV